MRANNNERAKDLYFKAFERALARADALQVAHVSMKYSRFLAFKCNDVPRACDVMEKASAVVRNSKVLFLSQLNLLRHLEGLGQLPSSPKSAGSRVISTFEKALFTAELTLVDRRSVAHNYLEYIRENAFSVNQIKAAEERLNEAGIPLLD